MRGPQHSARIVVVSLIAAAGSTFAGGPTILVEPLNMAQDAFPAEGRLHSPEYGRNHVRFDMGRDLYPLMAYESDPGDSIAFTVVTEPGAVLAGPPRLYWKRGGKFDTLWDIYRTAGLGTEGWVDCVAVPGAGLGRWSADLPDSGFLFPGDVLHYYLAATQDLEGVLTTNLAPSDTTGFDLVAPSAWVYEELYTVRCLPSEVPFITEPMDPDVLFWYDDEGDEGLTRWMQAYHSLGLSLGSDVDLYATNGPAANGGNGLGRRTTIEILERYDVIIYSSGRQAYHTLGVFDVNLFHDWFNWPSSGSMFLTGDHLVHDLVSNELSVVGLFAHDRMQVDLELEDLSALIGNEPSPLVLVTPGSGASIFTSVSSWRAWAGVSADRTFDAVLPIGDGIRLAEFAGPDGTSGGWPYSAATLATHGNFVQVRVVSLPYDLAAVSTDAREGAKARAGVPARARILKDVLNLLGVSAGGDPTAVSLPSPLTVTALPNPFNPRTTIRCTVDRPGHLTVRIFDPRGRLVRTLADGPVTTDADVTWNGTDERGQGVAAGVYLYEVKLDERTRTGKLALVR